MRQMRMSVVGGVRPTTAAAAASAKPTAAKQAVEDEALDSYNRVPSIHAITTSDLVRTVRVFAACTSAHGFYRLNHPVRSCQIGWTILIIAAFIAVAVSFSSSVTKFKDEPTSIKISPRGSRFVPPDITVCNNQMFAISKIFTSTYNSTTNQTVYRIAPAFQPVFDSIQKIDDVLEQAVKRYLLLKYGDNYQTDSNLLRIQEDGLYNLPNLIIRDSYGVKFLAEFSADQTQTLLSCTYGTRGCDIKDFRQISLPALPSCMTFSMQTFSQNRPNVTVNSLNELRLVLFADSLHDNPVVIKNLLKLPGDWFNLQTPGGAVVYVHQPGTFPTYGNRIEAPINRETVVNIRYLEYTSKSTRNYRCLTSPEQLQYMLLNDQVLKPLTFQAQLGDCYEAVVQEVLLNKCGFIDPTLPLSLAMTDQPRRGNLSNLLPNSTAEFSHAEPSSLISHVYKVFKQSSETELPPMIKTLLDNEICLRAAYVAASTDSRRQRCLDNCVAKVYSTSVMPIKWPETLKASTEYLRPLVQRWLQSNTFYTNGSTKTRSADLAVNEDFVRNANWNLFDSYSRLKKSAHSHNLNYFAIRFRVANPQGLDMQTEENASYELFDMLSDLGGFLGLFVGISVLTCCEVAELLLQLTIMIGMIIHRWRTESAKGGMPQQPMSEPARRMSQLVARMGMQMAGELEADDERGIAWQLQPRLTRV